MTVGDSIESIRDGLYSDETEAQQKALYTLFEAATEAEDWSAFDPLIDDLEALLEDDPFLREGAINALYRMDALTVEHVSQLNRIVEEDDSRLGFRTVDALFELSKASPETVAPVAPSMVDFLAVRDRENGEEDDVPDGIGTVDVIEHEEKRAKELHAARRFKADTLLSTVAGHDPERLLPEIAEFVAIAGREDYADLRCRILETAATVAETHAGKCQAAIDPAAVIVAEEENAKIRTKATYLLAMIAGDHLSAVAEAVDPHLEVLFDMLESAHADEQNAAIGLLSYVAEDRPEAVSPAMDVIVDCLDHHLESVRGNAIWTLEYVGDDAVLDSLESIAQSDPSDDIRALASETSASLASD